ncbi:MAG: alpha/beta fold hydrolase [Steroidobacteraceae bacterium]
MHLFWLAICSMLAIGSSAFAAEGEPLTLQELRAKYADPAGKIALVGGVEVYYKDEGAGPAIMMVHGSQSTLKTWDYIAPKLTDRYRVIRYDVPAQGLSGTVTDEHMQRLQPVDIAEGLLAQLGVDKVTFVGVSSGGTLGVYLAAKRPDLVERLILSNTPADTVTTGHLPPSPNFLEQQRIAKETGLRNRAYWNAFLDYFSGDPARLATDIREQYYDFNRRAPEPHLIGLVAKVADQEKAKAAMKAVKAPALLIWGAKDLLLPVPAGKALAGYLSGTDVSMMVMPDVGHYPPLESPDRFVKILEAYIEAATP